MIINYDYEDYGVRIKATVMVKQALPDGSTLHVMRTLEDLHAWLVTKAIDNQKQQEAQS